MKFLSVEQNRSLTLGHILSLVTLSCLFFAILPFVSHAAPRQLERGMYGEDVRALQVMLNADEATQVTPIGAGSPGMETSYFGAATEAALIKFQEINRESILNTVGLKTSLGVYGKITQAFVSTEATFALGSAEPLTAGGLLQSRDLTKSVTLEGLTEGSTVNGDIIVVANPAGFAQVLNVTFAIDGVVVRTEKGAPYSLGSNEADLKLLPFSTITLSEGAHRLLVTVTGDNTITKKEFAFIVKNIVTPPKLLSISDNAELCASENKQCTFSGLKQVRYGVGTTFVTKTISGGTPCTNAVFGDPKFKVVKACYILEVPKTVVEVKPTPNATGTIPTVVAPALPVVRPIVVTPAPVVITPVVPVIPAVPKVEVKPVTPVVSPVTVVIPPALVVSTIPTVAVTSPVVTVDPVPVAASPIADIFKEAPTCGITAVRGNQVDIWVKDAATIVLNGVSITPRYPTAGSFVYGTTVKVSLLPGGNTSVELKVKNSKGFHLCSKTITAQGTFAVVTDGTTYPATCSIGSAYKKGHGIVEIYIYSSDATELQIDSHGKSSTGATPFAQSSIKRKPVFGQGGYEKIAYDGSGTSTIQITARNQSGGASCNVIVPPDWSACTITAPASVVVGTSPTITWKLAAPTPLPVWFSTSVGVGEKNVKVGNTIVVSPEDTTRFDNVVSGSLRLSRLTKDTLVQVTTLARQTQPYAQYFNSQSMIQSSCKLMIPVTKTGSSSVGTQTSSSNDTYTSTGTSAPKSGSGTSAPKSGSGLGTPSLQNGLGSGF